jgi:hypothetical protein
MPIRSTLVFDTQARRLTAPSLRETSARHRQTITENLPSFRNDWLWLEALSDVAPAATGPKMDLLDHLIGTGNQLRRDIEAERTAAGPGLNQSLLRERRKLPFAWQRLDHLGERFSIVEELGRPQDRGRGTTAPRFVCQPPGLSFMM